MHHAIQGVSKKMVHKEIRLKAEILTIDYLYPQLLYMPLKTICKRRKISGLFLLGIHLELRYS